MRVKRRARRLTDLKAELDRLEADVLKEFKECADGAMHFNKLFRDLERAAIPDVEGSCVGTLGNATAIMSIATRSPRALNRKLYAAPHEGNERGQYPRSLDAIRGHSEPVEWAHTGVGHGRVLRLEHAGRSHADTAGRPWCSGGSRWIHGRLSDVHRPDGPRYAGQTRPAPPVSFPRSIRKMRSNSTGSGNNGGYPVVRRFSISAERSTTSVNVGKRKLTNVLI